MPKFLPGDVLSYAEMCLQEGMSLQQGMNFYMRGGDSVLLMSRRRGAPYTDRFEEEGRVLIYEGHDEPRRSGGENPKRIDQPSKTKSGRPTPNGIFFNAAQLFAIGKSQAKAVRVYEKIQTGIWVFNGRFRLEDSWIESSNRRKVFKFKLRLDETELGGLTSDTNVLIHTRLIPSAVKLEVWTRDKGRCVECGAVDHLHYDHDLPFSKGGTSILAENIRLLCARHNLAKGAKIQ